VESRIHSLFCGANKFATTWSREFIRFFVEQINLLRRIINYRKEGTHMTKKTRRTQIKDLLGSRKELTAAEAGKIRGGGKPSKEQIIDQQTPTAKLVCKIILA
jgi:hypothetical protein